MEHCGQLGLIIQTLITDFFYNVAIWFKMTEEYVVYNVNKMNIL